jgi:glycosyltransferase involved in cell wall biosynthesis
MKVAVCGINPKSQHFRRYLDFLVAQGYDVTAITDADTVAPAVTVVNFARPIRGRRFMPPGVPLGVLLWRLRRALRRGGFDVLDVQQVTPVGLYAAMLWRGPLVLDFWGSDIMQLDRRPWPLRLLMRRVIAKAACIHSVSDQITRALVARGADETTIETFQYGVDLSEFTFAPGGRDCQTVVWSRGLREFYRLETMLRAWPAVVRRRPAARLIVTKSGANIDRWKALAEELGIGASVEFVGRVPYDEVGEILRRAAVWVSIPPSDGAPLSLLEEMASGAFPVVSDLDSVREWLDDDRAVFVPQVDAEHLAEAVVRGLELAADGAYATANRRVVEERGDRRLNLPRWERMLVRAAAQARG